MRLAPTFVKRFWARVGNNGPVPPHRPALGPCWPWTWSRTKAGYGQIVYRGAHHYAHRLAWEMTRGAIPGKLFVLHHCDNPCCCNPSHLFLGTIQDNTADMVAKGRHRVEYGETHPTAKLTDAVVAEIRRRWIAGGISQVQLGKEYGVHSSWVSRIVRHEFRRKSHGREDSSVAF